MRKLAIVVGCLAFGMVAAVAEPCPGNPNALGTSRTLTVDAATFPRIGTVQYRNTLPLADHEVVITFDDGPLPPYTDRVLNALAAECVKATYFLVGTMARANPALVRRIYNEGHTIGTHSLSHPLTFDQMDLPSVAREVNGGIALVRKAAGDARAVSPFFRIPGLARSRQVESYLASQSLSVWSADEVADDWIRGVTAKEIVRRAIGRLESKGHRGVLLLHDINPATAMAVPALLKELKARKYRVVLAVPEGQRSKSVPELPPALVADSGGWPRVAKTGAAIKSQATKSQATKSRLAKSATPQRQRIARGNGDPLVTASIARKKRKTVAAGTTTGWFSR